MLHFIGCAQITHYLFTDVSMQHCSSVRMMCPLCASVTCHTPPTRRATPLPHAVPLPYHALRHTTYHACGLHATLLCLSLVLSSIVCLFIYRVSPYCCKWIIPFLLETSICREHPNPYHRTKSSYDYLITSAIKIVSSASICPPSLQQSAPPLHHNHSATQVG